MTVVKLAATILEETDGQAVFNHLFDKFKPFIVCKLFANMFGFLLMCCSDTFDKQNRLV